MRRAEFARRAERAKSTISKACRGELAEAVLEKGHVDAAHPAVVQWAAARGIPPARLLDQGAIEEGVRGMQGRGARRRQHSPRDPDDLSRILDMSIREVTDLFGSHQRFRDWVVDRRRLIAADREELALAELEGRLIRRELVRKHVLSHVDRMNLLILRDAAKTLAKTIASASASGATQEECVGLAREVLGKHIRAAKAQAQTTLRKTARRTRNRKKDR